MPDTLIDPESVEPSVVGVPIAILTSSDAVKDRHRIAVGEQYNHGAP